MVKRYLEFIKEANEEVQKVDSSKYTEIKDEIKSMIEKTIEKSGGEFASFVDKFVKEPEDVKIEGLINDSDLYDFYLKFRNDIDEILNDIKFFGNAPSEVNAIGLYDYLIKGTQKSIEEAVKLLAEGGEKKEEKPETPEGEATPEAPEGEAPAQA
jgi:deoxyribodipyrimidine photolyase